MLSKVILESNQNLYTKKNIFIILNILHCCINNNCMDNNILIIIPFIIFIIKIVKNNKNIKFIGKHYSDFDINFIQC